MVRESTTECHRSEIRHPGKNLPQNFHRYPSHDEKWNGIAAAANDDDNDVQRYISHPLTLLTLAWR